MNLLIVDDEISSIRAVSHMLDLSALGIDQCYTALSAQEARDCIINNPVDILLCDIEMPQESGLDLLEWVNSQKLDIYCVYMTCFAEFSYAQRAVSLGSTAYLLKPIDPDELTRELRTAIDKKREMLKMRSAHQSLVKNQENLCQRFWLNLFYENIVSETRTIQQQIDKFHLPLKTDWSYCPVLLVIRSWGTGKPEENNEDTRLMRYALHNIAEELFGTVVSPVSCWHTVFPFGKNAQLAICGGQTPEELQNSCITFGNQYLEMEEQYCDLRSVCYTGRAVTIEQTADEIEELLKLDQNHLPNHGLVVHSALQQAQQPETDPDDRFDRWKSELAARFRYWTRLLDGGLYSRAEQEITDYLSCQEQNIWFTKGRFRYFLNHYAGMLTEYAHRHQFPLNQLTAAPEDASCFEVSDHDLDCMKAWVKSGPNLQKRNYIWRISLSAIPMRFPPASQKCKIRFHSIFCRNLFMCVKACRCFLLL